MKPPRPPKTRIDELRKKLKPELAGLRDRWLQKVSTEGVAGVRALLAKQHPAWKVEVVELGAEGCPWPAGAPAAVAKQALGALATRLPLVVAMLSKATVVCAAKHTPAKKAPDLGGWFLIYLLPGPRVFVGGPPTPDPACAVVGWELPASLCELMQRHDGFGILCDELGLTGVDPGIQPSPRLASPEVAPMDKAYRPTDLLRFTRGTGEAGEGGWCFARESALLKKKQKKADVIVDVEDRFGRLGAPVPHDFWGFLDRYLTDGDLPTADT